MEKKEKCKQRTLRSTTSADSNISFIIIYRFWQCGWTLISIRINHPFYGGKSLPAKQEDNKFQILVFVGSIQSIIQLNF